MHQRLLYILLFPIPVIWLLLSYIGWLDGLKNEAMDWRFRQRGPIESPAKIIYVDMDSAAIALDWVGERPWDRRFFADVGGMLLELGEARVVGFDFVFSPKSMSQMVPQENIVKSDQAIASLVNRFPDRVVLAADYTGVQLRHMMIPSRAPLKYLGYREASTNAYPEGPSFPMINYHQGRQIGRMGIISVDELKSQGAIPRWCPMYFEYTGPVHSRNIAYGREFVYQARGLETEVLETDDEIQIALKGNVISRLPRNLEMRLHHFTLEMFLAAERLDDSAVHVMGDRLEVRDEDGKVLLEVPLVDEQLVEVNWFSPWISDLNPRFSIAELYYHGLLYNEEDNPEAIAQADAFFAQFRDALVLVGPTDRLLQDLAPTPFDDREVPKVGVHGNLLKTLYSGRFIHRLSWSWEVILTLLLSLVAVASAIYSGKYNATFKAGALVILGGFIGVVLIYFASHDLVIPLVAPMGAASSAVFVGIVAKLFVEERQKGRIKGMFGTYVSPELVEQMVESGEEPQLGGHEESITAFFSDIQSFSTFSEQLKPKELVALMNEYLTSMTDLLQAERGTLDKYIGDAIVAMFGAPIPIEEHARRACDCAVKVQRRQLELRKKWKFEAGKWPPIVHRMATRIGLNSGPAIVGNMGSETRFNYTMMGDTVNLAARCESSAKAYGVYTMVAEDTYQLAQAQGADNLLFRHLDKIQVQGRSQPTGMYELIEEKSAVSSEVVESVSLYEAALQRYYQQDWDKALGLFQQASALERFNPSEDKWIQTNPSLVMVARCQLMKLHPPGENWDGVYRMRSK